VDMFFKTGSGSPALAAARVAKGRTFKIQRTGFVSGEGSVFGFAGDLPVKELKFPLAYFQGAGGTARACWTNR